MSTKNDVIRGAYSQMRISGLTVNPSPEDSSVALERLEDMMAEFESNNICLDYNFTLEPDPSDITNVSRSFNQMMQTNLATRLIPDFNKVVPQTLISLASSTLSNAVGFSAAKNIKEITYPRRMPLGSGNTLRTGTRRRFQQPQLLPDVSCANNFIIIGDVNDYQESYVPYLNNLETIASFVITSDSGLTVQSSANNSPLISYRVLATSNATKGSWQQVKIVVTTSDGRIDTRLINFEIQSDKTVGAN
tara:strand:- start:341 stop:1084 length:744 start_codon:yes stop_codon:yes gene_type:complete